MTKTQIRAALYVTLAVGATLQQGIAGVHSVKDGVILAISVIVTAATTLRAFIDTTPADEAALAAKTPTALSARQDTSDKVIAEASVEKLP
jgi:hypothetical protein